MKCYSAGRFLFSYFLVQEFIKEASSSDIRCFVLGNKVIGAMMREAKDGDFRANIHRGAEPKPIELTNEEKSLAIRAARIMGLNVAGVDIIRSERGPLVLEVNSSPGLQGIEKVTQKDIAGKIIRYIEEHAFDSQQTEKGN